MAELNERQREIHEEYVAKIRPLVEARQAAKKALGARFNPEASARARRYREEIQAIEARYRDELKSFDDRWQAAEEEATGSLTDQIHALDDERLRAIQRAR